MNTENFTSDETAGVVSHSSSIRLPSQLSSIIPPERHEDILQAIKAAFGNCRIDGAVQLAGGASGPAHIFRITVNEADFLLRIEGPILDSLRDPARQYKCQKIASDAGVAPRLIYADAHHGVAITEFIHAAMISNDQSRPAQLKAMVNTVKTLHNAPLFPGLMHYLDCVDILIHQVRKTGILPAEVLEEHLYLYNTLTSAYPRYDPDLVSSHNDLNPSNVLFTGERPWIVDWESAFATDRYVDIAAIANFFALNEVDEAIVLQTYFGPKLNDYHKARFFLMRQVNRMFYAMVLLNSVAAVEPGIRLKRTSLTVPRFHEVRGEMASLASHAGRIRFGCVFLNEMRCNIQNPRFLEYVAQADIRR